MKEDYLWNKTGDDPEIERLENVLTVFRYQENAAPALPAAEAVPFAEKAPRWKFSLVFAFAACVAVVTLLGAWFQISTGRLNGPEQSVAVADPPQIDGEKRNEPIVNKDYRLDDEKVDAKSHTIRRDPANVRRSVTSINRRNKTIDKSSENKRSAVALTSEEKYAYGQLMLALSITGSKLKIVQDTIDGVENRENAVTKNER